jgi:hypothetical protein
MATIKSNGNPIRKTLRTLVGFGLIGAMAISASPVSAASRKLPTAEVSVRMSAACDRLTAANSEVNSAMENLSDIEAFGPSLKRSRSAFRSYDQSILKLKPKSAVAVTALKKVHVHTGKIIAFHGSMIAAVDKRDLVHIVELATRIDSAMSSGAADVDASLRDAGLPICKELSGGDESSSEETPSATSAGAETPTNPALFPAAIPGYTLGPLTESEALEVETIRNIGAYETVTGRRIFDSSNNWVATVLLVEFARQTPDADRQRAYNIGVASLDLKPVEPVNGFQVSMAGPLRSGAGLEKAMAFRPDATFEFSGPVGVGDLAQLKAVVTAYLAQLPAGSATPAPQ